MPESDKRICMGGWCRRREACSRYIVEPAHGVIERMCGADFEFFESLPNARAALWIAALPAKQGGPNA